MSDFLEIFRSGLVCGLCIRDHESAIYDRFGEPEYVGYVNRRNNQPKLLKYGDVQFGIEEEYRNVLWIGVYFADNGGSACGWGNLSLNSFPINGLTSIEMFKDWLSENKIFHDEIELSHYGFCRIRVRNVEVFFDSVDNEIFQLQKILISDVV